MGNIQQIIWAFLVTLAGRPSRSAAHRKSWSWTYGFRCKKILINQTFANFIKWYGFMSIFRNFILFSKIETSCVSFFKNGPSPASLCLFSFFTKKHYNSYNKFMSKMSIQYTTLGFKPTTFRTWVTSHDHQTRAPFILLLVCFLSFLTEFYVMSNCLDWKLFVI